jgi:zinc metalloprotease ZmpB
LCTSHFRIYRSIGGDAATVAEKQFAGRYVAYLILRAIGTLTPATNPRNVAGWVTALINEELGDWTTEGLPGGVYGKVIRWAFEKQGLFQPPGTPSPIVREGAPPPVDVYVDDGRHGEYPYQPAYWNNPSIWNRRNPDGLTAHENPVVNVTNFAYVKIKNRGTQVATSVKVQAFHAFPGVGLSYPNDWIAMSTPQLAGADVPANNAGEVIVGPFQWTPTRVGHECVFMVVSAAGDASNITNITTGETVSESRLVPHDNNIGMPNMTPVAGAGGARGLIAAMGERPFVVRNPLRTRAKIVIKPVLPPVLSQRAWRIDLTGAGGGAFSLEPGTSQEVGVRLLAGDEFNREDVANERSPDIRLDVFANDLLIGGVTFRLDPTMTGADPA